MVGSVFVMTVRGDEHAHAVHHVLSQLGVGCHLYYPTDIIGGADYSVAYTDNDAVIEAGGFHGALSEIGSVWNRRLSQTFRDPEFVHPADREHLVYAAHSFNRGLAVLLDDRFGVNPLKATVLTSNKLNQIRVASQCGLRVPRTLISSDPVKIREFVGLERRACVKPYTMQAWRTEEGFVASATAIIDHPIGLDDESMGLIPNIYQEYIDKTCEYRVTMFGLYVVATKINSQKLSGGMIDWRADITYLNHLEPATLPDSIVLALRKLMSRLGLRFGSFDLVQDKDGEIVFLEVNEAGQWLWQELYCEHQVILEPFSRFLASCDETFDGSSNIRSPDLSASSVLNIIKSTNFYPRSDDNVDGELSEQDLISKLA